MANATTARSHISVENSRALNVGLWIVQWLLAVTFVGTGVWKLATPIAELAQAMPWMGEVAPSILYATAIADVAVGLGILLPSLTRIKPSLTVEAAYACAAFMACAFAFHLSRGEGASTPFNVLIAVLALFVAWGRRTKVPIEPRPILPRE